MVETEMTSMKISFCSFSPGRLAAFILIGFCICFSEQTIKQKFSLEIMKT